MIKSILFAGMVWLLASNLFFSQAVIKGEITGLRGYPLEGAEVRVMPFYDSLVRYTAVTDASGQFEIPVETNYVYRVVVSHPIYGQQAYPMVFVTSEEKIELGPVKLSGHYAHGENIPSEPVNDRADTQNSDL